MAETSRNAVYKYFNGKEYERINFKTTPSQVECDENHRFVTDAEKKKWDGKANNVLATQSVAGIMSAADKKKLDYIKEGANKYEHPEKHSPSIISDDSTHRFVTDAEKKTWNGKANNVLATQSVAGIMSAADKKKLDELGKLVLGMVYPIGSIYMSVVDKDPSSFIGGTWLRWAPGMVPVGVDTSDGYFNTVEKKGGEKSHKLTIDELPSHAHEQRVTANFDGPSIRCDYDSDNRGQIYNQGIYTGNTGGDRYHNNLQPYITCYMWKRTA